MSRTRCSSSASTRRTAPLPPCRRASPRPTAPHRESFVSPWRASTDDLGPVTYRVYQDNRFISTTTSTSASLGIAESSTSSYTIRASDTVGHLSQPLTIRFRLGVGLVDARGKLVRDTVRPPAVGRVSVRRVGQDRPSFLAAGTRSRRPERLPGEDRSASPDGDEAGRDAEPRDAADRRLPRGSRPAPATSARARRSRSAACADRRDGRATPL